MLKILRLLILGGATGKREYALLYGLAWLFGFITTVVCEINGIVLKLTGDILMFSLLPILGFAAAALGMEWASTQTSLVDKKSQGVKYDMEHDRLHSEK